MYFQKKMRRKNRPEQELFSINNKPEELELLDILNLLNNKILNTNERSDEFVDDDFLDDPLFRSLVFGSDSGGTQDSNETHRNTIDTTIDMQHIQYVTQLHGTIEHVNMQHTSCAMGNSSEYNVNTNNTPFIYNEREKDITTQFANIEQILKNITFTVHQGQFLFNPQTFSTKSPSKMDGSVHKDFG